MVTKQHAVEAFGLLAFVVLAGLVLAFAYGSASAPAVPKKCDHGASSIYAWTDAHGVEHVSKPVTTGCVVPAGLRSP